MQWQSVRQEDTLFLGTGVVLCLSSGSRDARTLVGLPGQWCKRQGELVMPLLAAAGRDAAVVLRAVVLKLWVIRGQCEIHNETFSSKGRKSYKAQHRLEDCDSLVKFSCLNATLPLPLPALTS